MHFAPMRAKPSQPHVNTTGAPTVRDGAGHGSPGAAAPPMMDPARQPAGHAATPKPRLALLFAVVALPLLMSSLDQTIVATALDAMQHELGAPISWVGWTLTIYSLGLLLALPIAGKLSERHGRRRVFLASVALFTVASLCCGLAGNIEVLVALRFVQAIGGAGFTPAATGIIVEHFGHSRDKAVGLFGSIFSIGAMIGPIFGGLFVTWWSWRGIFFVNVPIGAALLLMCLRWIPADPRRPHGPHEPFDLVGMSTLGIGVLGMMLALNALAAGAMALRSAGFLAPAAIAVLSLALFARHTATRPRPFIAARFLAGHGFGAVNLINVVGGMVVGLVALVPLFAVSRYGIGALASGSLLTAEGAAFIAVSSVAALALRRTGYRRPLYLGTLVLVAGIIALSLHPDRMSPYGWLAIATAIIGVGAGLSSPASRNAGLQLAPASAPTLAALRTMGFQLGSITTIAITTAIIAGATDASTAHAHAYLGWAIVLLMALAIIPRIPEHRGAW